MICLMVTFTVTLSDPYPRFQGYGVIRPLNALDVLCAQLTRDLFAIAKFLFTFPLLFCLYKAARVSRSDVPVKQRDRDRNATVHISALWYTI